MESGDLKIVGQFESGLLSIDVGNAESNGGYEVAIVCNKTAMYVRFSTIEDVLKVFEDRAEKEFSEVQVTTLDGGTCYVEYTLACDERTPCEYVKSFGALQQNLWVNFGSGKAPS